MPAFVFPFLSKTLTDPPFVNIDTIAPMVLPRPAAMSPPFEPFERKEPTLPAASRVEMIPPLVPTDIVPPIFPPTSLTETTPPLPPEVSTAPN
jgi:hypothetical protein